MGLFQFRRKDGEWGTLECYKIVCNMGKVDAEVVHEISSTQLLESSWQQAAGSLYMSILPMYSISYK